MPTATGSGAQASAGRKTRPRKGTTAKKATAKTSRHEMTDEHKAAIREGRDQARAIGRYLEALDQHRPKRGRKVTKESREKRLAEITESLAEAAPLERVLLLAERDRIREFLDTANSNGDVDMASLEKDFVKHAKSYSERKDIPRNAWKEAGVPLPVLKAAGIKK